MKPAIASIMWLALALVSTPGNAAELPTSGKIDIASCWSGETHIITTSTTHTALSFRMTGATRSTPPGGLFDMTTFECVGVGTIIEGVYSRSGFCNMVDNDGDKSLGRFTATGPKGSYDIIHGSGKYAGMQANLTFDVIGQFPSVRPGTMVGCNRTTGNYTLP